MVHIPKAIEMDINNIMANRSRHQDRIHANKPIAPSMPIIPLRVMPFISVSRHELERVPVAAEVLNIRRQNVADSIPMTRPASLVSFVKRY
ncbi:hypothetical protein ACFLXP_04595 [Chloroflexota bacterium]